MTTEPKIIWTFPTIAFCAGCNSAAPINHEGRQFLFSYDDGPGVCSAACAATAAARPVGRPVARPAAASSSPGATRGPASDVLLTRARAAGGAALAHHMAEFIVQRAAGQQACTHDQLVEAGFAVEEIARHRKAAIAHAAGLAPDLRGEGAAA